MKTIEEAAKEYSSKTYLTCSTEDLNHDCNIFTAGVEFAQRWIPVEEELPTKGVEMLIKNESSGKKHIYTPKTSDDVKWICECFTHWRPIEYK